MAPPRYLIIDKANTLFKAVRLKMNIMCKQPLFVDKFNDVSKSDFIVSIVSVTFK